jgi:hypothetical protein
MVVNFSDVPNPTFEPLHLSVLAFILVLSLGIKAWIKRARQRKLNKQNLTKLNTHEKNNFDLRSFDANNFN